MFTHTTVGHTTETTTRDDPWTHSDPWGEVRESDWGQPAQGPRPFSEAEAFNITNIQGQQAAPTMGAWDAYEPRNGPTSPDADGPPPSTQPWSLEHQMSSLGIGNQSSLLPAPPERQLAEFGSTMASITGPPPPGDRMENNGTPFAMTFQESIRRIHSFRRPQNQETRTTTVSTWNSILGQRSPGAPIPPYGNLQMGAPVETRLPTALDQEGVQRLTSNSHALTEVGRLLARIRVDVLEQGSCSEFA